MSSGVPDLFGQCPFRLHLIIAHKDRDDEGSDKNLVSSKMKRRKEGVTSENQKKWLKHSMRLAFRLLYVRVVMQRLEFIKSIAGFMTEIGTLDCSIKQSKHFIARHGEIERLGRSACQHLI